MAFLTATLNQACEDVSQGLLDRHYFRKHGAKATYGQ
jgi:L-ribulose-5-phosphate 4-epimerase